MKKPLRALIIDDSRDDAFLITRQLERSGYLPTCERVDNSRAMKSMLGKHNWDVILCDYVMPHFSALEALRIAKENNSEIPFIIISGSIGEDVAVEAMRAGAHDYLMKNNLTRLGAAVEREISETQMRRQKKEAENLLKIIQFAVDHAGDEVYLIDPSGKFAYVNAKAGQSLGYTGEELLKMDVFGIDPSFNKGKWLLNWEELRQRGSFTVETSHRTRDGKLVPKEMTLNYIQFEGKSFNCAFARDIRERKKTEEQLKESNEKLRKYLEGTIHSLVMAVEMRDPYTAGHQKRVSKLACAIAKDMGFSQEAVEGVNMACFIHDLGKISVPSEILNKPGKLTDFEFGIIKTHPQAGYDILKEIEFPSPVAQAVYQHHERLNGSGYPRGLSGEQIILEARILAVADVVEAMASHRPYRPGMGITQALEEINRNKGTLYDPKVVNTCLHLFVDKDFKFERE
jgi:PAS domain S-box-containing protein/putative nucleotidyltransferase with HDIG domain